MKKINSLIIIFLAFSMSVFCQSKEQKEVNSAIEVFKKGVITADEALLKSITADELVYGHSNGKVQDKTEFIAEIVSKLPAYLSIDMSDQTIRISGNIAVVRHIYSAETMNNGSPGHVKIGNMMIWQKQHGKWKLLARQAYKLPV
jgi:uncharacterized protein YcfL